MHYFIIAAIICLIVIIQWQYYLNTRNKIKILRVVFPVEHRYRYGSNEPTSITGEQKDRIISDYENVIFKEIVRSINAYLSKNSGRVSDYHLMKDIVDRNCDAAEEEIDSQVPVPLYLGLMGTMAGILVGVGYLWLSGDLDSLINVRNDLNSEIVGSGADGIKALLGGVALAMIASIMGILLTTWGSMKLKDAKAVMQKGKHTFLSWMQANMLPHLNNDTAQVLERMTRNLSKFNQDFYGNTKELRAALSQVNETARIQGQLIEAVNQLANKHVAKQNLDLYNALRNSTEEIGKLAELLHDSTEYLDAVRKLNARLDKGERRSEAIERMVVFFESETQQIEQRKVAMTHALGQIDSTLEENLRQLGNHANKNLEGFSMALGKQQDVLQKRLNETDVLIQEIRNLAPIKDSVSKFEKATKEQNAKIDALSKAIRQLAEAKSESKEVVASSQTKNTKERIVKRILFSAAVFVGLLFVAVIIANWDNIYRTISLLKF